MPIGFLIQLSQPPAAFQPSSETISDMRAEKRRSMIGSGVFIVMRTVWSSTFTTSLRFPRNSQAAARPGARSPEKRSGPNEKTTSSAVMGVPSWNFTPGRSLNSTVSGEMRFQLSARPGFNSPVVWSALTRVSNTAETQRSIALLLMPWGSMMVGSCGIAITMLSAPAEAAPDEKVTAAAKAAAKRVFVKEALGLSDFWVITIIIPFGSRVAPGAPGGCSVQGERRAPGSASMVRRRRPAPLPRILKTAYDGALTCG